MPVIVQVIVQEMEVECAFDFVGCVLEKGLWFHKWIAYAYAQGQGGGCCMRTPRPQPPPPPPRVLKGP